MTRAGVTDAAVQPAAPAGVVDDRIFGITDLRSHTARGVLINAGYQMGLVGVSALRGLVAAAFLTRSAYGVWGLIGLTLWTALGLKYVFGANEKYVQQSEENQEHAFQRAFTVEVIFAAASAPVAVLVVIVYALVTNHPVVLAPGLIMLLILPATVLQFPAAAYFRRMNYRRQRTLQAVEPIIAASLTVLLAALGAGYWSFVVGALVGAWAGALVALRASPYRVRLRYDSRTLRNYVGFSVPLLINGLSVLALFQVVALVGVSAVGLAGLGAFTLAGNLVQFTDQADAIVTETLYPAICAVRDRVQLLAEAFVKSNRLSLMWAVPFGVGMALFGSDLVRFFIGRHWLPAVPLLQIMGIVTAVNHVGYNWTAFYKARGITWPIAVSSVVTAGVGIAAAIPLIYTYHLIGIGYAFAIGAAVALLVRAVLIARLFSGFRMARHLLRAFLPTIIAVAPVLCIRAAVGAEHSRALAIAMFALYVALTVLATIAFERPLLKEAVGYLMRRRPQLA